MNADLPTAVARRGAHGGALLPPGGLAAAAGGSDNGHAHGAGQEAGAGGSPRQRDGVAEVLGGSSRRPLGQEKERGHRTLPSGGRCWWTRKEGTGLWVSSFF